MYGKNLKMVKSKNRRTIKAPARLIAADDEAQVLTQVEMEDENAQEGCYDVVYNHKLQTFVRAEDGSSEVDEMDNDDQYHKEVYLPILYFWGCK